MNKESEKLLEELCEAAKEWGLQSTEGWGLPRARAEERFNQAKEAMRKHLVRRRILTEVINDGQQRERGATGRYTRPHTLQCFVSIHAASMLGQDRRGLCNCGAEVYESTEAAP